MQFVTDYFKDYLPNIKKGKFTTALSVFCVVAAGVDLYFQRSISERFVELVLFAFFVLGLPDVPSKKKSENKSDQDQL